MRSAEDGKSLKFPEEEETPPAADGGHAPPAASPLPGSAAYRRPALRILHLPVPICARASFLEHSSLSLSVYIHPCKQPTGSVSLENPAAKLAHTGHPIVTRQACEQEKLQITDTAERVQMSTPCGRHPTVSSPRGLQGRHQRAPPLQGRRLWRKTALHDTCSSPWPEPGGSGRELLLHHQLRPKAETRVLGLGQGDRHGEQLGRCWGHKGRIILRGTELINGTFMRPPRRTQATHPHGMAI